MKKFALLCTGAALIVPTMAFAQSTGSQEIEEEIVVTGRNGNAGVGGVVIPDSPKARVVLTQELIERQVPGQSILDTINLIPGVNFTNSDAYGSSGGNLRIRGFDGNRISLTFDGMPLNDSGNYAIYSNQQLDPEIIEQVNVNMGATDVDSPTAAASGGTVNYRSLVPSDELGGKVSASYGDDNYHRVFGMINTGVFTSFGTKAWIAASTTRYDKFKGPGELDKQQYNARLYQPLGSNGDFISIAGHYNENRNDFYRNPGLTDIRTLTGLPLTASASNPADLSGFTKAQEDLIFNFDNFASCTRDAPTAGVRDDDNSGSSSSLTGTASCSNFYGVRVNPSNTGNVRVNSRFTLTDNLILTVDPSFQYVLAHGGGSTAFNENDAQLRGSATTSPGVDLNGDGDFLDRVRLFTPNITNTRRWGVTASLIWDLAPEHRFRVAYTYDRARHRQTGEYGFLDANGHPENIFSGRNGTPVLDASGAVLQQRDRLSIALLNQVSGEYRGRFMDDKLNVVVGLRAPFFERDLDQNCYTQTNGFAYCTTQPAATVNTAFIAPFTAQYKFDKLLPNVGMTYKFTDDLSMFASYAKGLSAPRTDNLYRAVDVQIDPETSDSIDLGLRYGSGRIQAQATGWFIGFQNRIVTSFDQDLGIAIDRNVGKVESYGVDASVMFKPIDPVSLYVFGSYINTEIKDNIQIGGTAAAPVFAPTAGMAVPETPEWQFGGRAQVRLGPVSLGAQAKYVGERYATDLNDVKVGSYTLVDLDARLSLEQWGLDKTYFQLNVRNLFDKFYLGNISTQIAASTIGGVAGSSPSFSVGAPRTILGTLVVGF